MTATGSYDFRGIQTVDGRFTQTDDGENLQTASTLLDQHIADPQSWNLYAYGGTTH
ncbi:MAG: hypothetical protein ABI693_35605 [Bryobacteraceae bacterium]